MEITYKLLYSNRKTFGLTVERDKSIIVRSPKNASSKDIEKFVEKKRYWLYSKLNHPQKYRKSDKIEFISGASLLYLGRSYKLKISNEYFDKLIFTNNFVISKKNKDRAQQMFKDWYFQRALKKITIRAKYYARNIGVEYNSIKITEIRYRWGSCTPKSELRFNWRIIKAPLPVIDYVIVHELVHLVEKNHTGEFWRMVKCQLPRYKELKEWLKLNGQELERDL